MANKIISLLRYEPLHSHIREEAHRNFGKFSWDLPAQKIYNIYHEISRR
jgi:glycosyltransferase involved in cell wall biosynthesis